MDFEVVGTFRCTSKQNTVQSILEKAFSKSSLHKVHSIPKRPQCHSLALPEPWWLPQPISHDRCDLDPNRAVLPQLLLWQIERMLTCCSMKRSWPFFVPLILTGDLEGPLTWPCWKCLEEFSQKGLMMSYLIWIRIHRSIKRNWLKLLPRFWRSTRMRFCCSGESWRHFGINWAFWRLLAAKRIHKHWWHGMCCVQLSKKQLATEIRST